MVKVEFAGLGLFLTLGNITPRFLVEDRCELEDNDIPGLAVELGKLVEPAILLELLKLLIDTVFDEVEEDIDIDTDETMVVGFTGETVVSTGMSSESPTYLKKISSSKDRYFQWNFDRNVIKNLLHLLS